MLVVEALRKPVEERLDQLRRDAVACSYLNRSAWQGVCMTFFLRTPAAVLTCFEAHPVVKILDSKVREEDLLQDDNYALMQSYVIHMFKNQHEKSMEYVSSKEHRVPGRLSL